MTGFQIAGPKARDVLVEAVAPGQALAAEGMRFLDVARLTVGMTDCLVQRVSYTGDLGYEIYCRPEAQRALWRALWQAGEGAGMRAFGMRAMMSLRLDRFFGSWLREYSPDYTAAETGLDRFIGFGKDADFIGKAAAKAERDRPPDRVLQAFEVAAADADVFGYEPLWIDGAVRGFCTSGGYAHWSGMSVALAFVPRERVADGLEAEVEILGERRAARLMSAPRFDPEGLRLRV